MIRIDGEGLFEVFLCLLCEPRPPQVVRIPPCGIHRNHVVMMMMVVVVVMMMMMMMMIMMMMMMMMMLMLLMMMTLQSRTDAGAGAEVLG
jgi:hypothetical protein